MHTFVGRTGELQALETAYHSARFAFIPIYGRRRIGKSELILHFLEGKPSVYFLGKKAPAALQIREFLQHAAARLEQPLLAEAAAADWGTALRLVLDHRPKGRFVLALDEYQWTAQASPELPSLLQELCDRESRGNSTLMLILCGSYLGFMEKEVLGRKSPLFGRRTAQILLRPFPYREAALFHPRLPVAERAMIYFLCGGIPYYLRFFQPTESVPMNIRKQLLSEFAALFREPDFLLREELKEVENYSGILFALASGASDSRRIADRTGIPERSLHYYLQTLSDLGYVARKHPLAGPGAPARRIRFGIEDPLLRFWFRFVYPHLTALTQYGADRVFSDLIAPNLEAYFGSCFERLCRESLPALYRQEGVASPFTIGEYWDSKIQIDVVGRRDDHWVDLGECKWGSLRSAPAVETELAERMRHYPNPANAMLQGRIFCRHAPVKTGSNRLFRWHSLEDLYTLPE